MDEKSIKAAVRLAKAIASDISIYNPEKIERALQNDNVFDVIGDELEEGKSTFQNRVSKEIWENTNIFEKAIIDTIFARRKRVKTPIW
jgi:hypothetical protein